MALDISKLGRTYDELTEVIDGDRAKAYAAATNDDNPAYTSGKYAPPVFAVVPAWAALGLAVGDVIPPEVLMMVVHGEQDMHFSAPLVPGVTLRTAAEAYSVRVGGSGTRFTVKTRSVDDATGDPIVEQYITVFVRGMADGESAGPDKPDHTFPDAARANKVGEYSVHVDDDQTFRYRDASGDQMPIHLDNDFAKSVGLPGIIAHGLCTMAMTSQAVIKVAADGDPGRLKRLAVRMAKNVFPGNEDFTTVYRGDAPGAFPFEAHIDGEHEISNGLAQIQP
jgi:acyl dehydratase